MDKAQFYWLCLILLYFELYMDTLIISYLESYAECKADYIVEYGYTWHLDYLRNSNGLG